MKTNYIKISVLGLFAVALGAVALLNVGQVQTVTNAKVLTKAAADAAADYTAKCAMCHGKAAEKKFDAAKTIEHHTEVILKGVKDSKPPMPGYEAKGMTAEQAKALAEYMMQLRKPAASSNTNTAGNTTASDDKIKLNEQLAATYKTKCAMCHGKAAEKSFDASKKDEELAEIVKKGKAPMPGYEAKGMKAEEAVGLVGYMRGLRDAAK